MNEFETLELFSMQMGSTMSDAQIMNIRGKNSIQLCQRKRKRNEVSTLDYLKTNFSGINHLLPSESTISGLMFSPKFNTVQYHMGQMRCHLQLLESKNTESVYVKTGTSEKYLVSCVTDEQGIGQNAFQYSDISGHYMLGFDKVISANDLTEMGLAAFQEKVISKEIQFISSVREFLVLDYGGMFCSNIATFYSPKQQNQQNCNPAEVYMDQVII